MTTTSTTSGLLSDVLAAGSVGVEPIRASHLVGLGPSASPYALRHAVKVRAGGSAEPLERLLIPTDESVTRWLVWLGAARPPAPPTHVRVSLVDTGPGLAALVRLAEKAGFALPAQRPVTGLMFPTDGGDALYVTSNIAGQAEVSVARRGEPVPEEPESVYGDAWREAQVYDGRRHDDPELRLAGMVAEPHHRQLLGGEDRLVLLVRPHRSVTA